MSYLAQDEKIRDADFCRQKEAEYSAKARATNNLAIKSAYEAAAREYAHRARLIDSATLIGS
jgi:hypothetical protein